MYIAEEDYFVHLGFPHLNYELLIVKEEFQFVVIPEIVLV